MKIGVVTFWYGNNNYGMILQCWALQQHLKKLGHEPFVIKFTPYGSKIRKIIKSYLGFLKLFNNKNRIEYVKKKRMDLYNAEKDKNRKFEDFRLRYLKFSEYSYYHLSDLKNNPPKADCYIAGSDQIWCSVSEVDDSMGFFLDFGDSTIRRVAYAPSIGKVYPKSKLRLFSKALSNFDYISCREQSAVDLCKRLGYNAIKVDDPTLLLSSEDYTSLCQSIDYKDFVFIYSVNMHSADAIYWPTIKNMFSKKKVVVTPAGGNIQSSELFGNDVEYKYATPGEWLSLIRDANLIITSSFHGVVFSIIFNKKFAYVPISGVYSSGNNRITDLLKSLDLECCIINKPEDYDRVFNDEIDWNFVNNRRLELIDRSFDFLKKSLE